MSALKIKFTYDWWLGKLLLLGTILLSLSLVILFEKTIWFFFSVVQRWRWKSNLQLLERKVDSLDEFHLHWCIPLVHFKMLVYSQIRNKTTKSFTCWISSCSFILSMKLSVSTHTHTKPSWATNNRMTRIRRDLYS